MADAMMLNSTCCSNLSVVFSNNCENRCGAAIFSNKSAIFAPSGMSYPSLKLRCDSVKPSSSSSEFFGGKVAPMVGVGGATGGRAACTAQMSIGIRKAQKWWEKGLQPNMKEVTGAQDLVDSLLNAGDKLVVLDFFSPGCGGCKALHPKICQLAEMNPDVQFLQVNYEEHKSMCYSLNVHVLPFFRFYRGAEGRVCSFSCTNATIKKFKDALAKYSPDRCGLGPPRGLEEKELLALAANKDLSFTYSPAREESVPVPAEEEYHKEAARAAAPALPRLPLPLPLPSTTAKVTQETKEKSLVNAGR